MHEEEPQLVFLDVEMPFGNAFDVLEGCKDLHFETIFVTAFSEYSLKALNQSAAYYLLKPISIEELILAVNKVQQQLMKQELFNRNQIIVQNDQNSGPLQTNSNKIIGFPNTGIIVPASVAPPLIIFSGNRVTMAGSVNGILILTGGMEITGNLNIKGNLTVDGTISTSTAFRGDNTNNQPESLGEDTYMDAGEY